MNLRISLKIADVLALASARAKTSGIMVQSKKTIWEYTNFVMGILFAVIAIPVVYFGVKNWDLSNQVLTMIFNQMVFFIPVAVTFSCIVFAIFYEFNQSTFNISMDSINWLPISAGDYVLGSSICTLYFSLPILGMVYGATFAVAFMTGSLMVWVLTLVLGLIGGLIGGFATEILRAITNKATATMFKKGGQASLFGRFFVYL